MYFLDASKAFDRVEYGKLFQLLIDRRLPSHIIRLLLNMYTGQQVRVFWNGIYSHGFSVMNGVKQGAIISPILFCVYLDTLLVRLKEAGVGCYLGMYFVGALAYADDVVLLSPSASAMRRMLLICDQFAAEYNVVFNVNKTKCLNLRSSKHTSLAGRHSPLPSFSLGGNVIENVSKWPHLGHIITSQCSDSVDIAERKKCFIGQVNNLLCNFSKLDSLVKCKLFNSYCSNYYGAELWDLDDVAIESFCVAWRKGMRRVWGLPADTSCDIVYLIAGCIPIYDELCRRFVNFTYTALNCGSNFVNFVVRHALLSSPAKSPIGRNVISCLLRYDISLDSLSIYRRNKSYYCERWSSNILPDVSARACRVFELVLIRDGALRLPDCFKRTDVQTLIEFNAVSH